ncbi:WD40 repeat domain-containing protein [Glycomyces buryatensis]|uniref:WD40 repeat domain-containing protein n=1 Tax=Glycomyces buryatensis TaxID=2570927 RepID=A0A4S8Q1K9_9ACTN|nr:WD40 repeat domain-containing protein [Glycomyces buryatensis]THV36365.1 WD40 repeat domain-containing protein [Glycomyces buryatensis]
MKPKLRARLRSDLTWEPVYHGLRSNAIFRLERSGDPEAFAVLAQVFASTSDDWTQGQVRQALERIREDQAGIDAMAGIVVSTGDEALAALIAERAPADPLSHAVVLYLAGEFDRYEDLDFDGSLMRAAHRAGTPALRQALAQVARTSGRLQWVRTVAGERRPDLDRLSAAEWEAAIASLVRARRWGELVDLATRAPVTVGADILCELASHDWHPSDRDGRREFAHLAKLAAAARQARPPQDGPFSDADAQVLDGGLEVRRLAVSPDGSMLASTGATEPVRFWHLPTGTTRRTLTGWAKGVKGMMFTPDGEQFVAGDRGGRIARWSVQEERPLDPLVGHRRKVLAFAAALDGRTLFSSGSAGEIRTWELPSGRPGVVFKGDLWSFDLALSTDGTRLFSGGTGLVRVHRLPDGAVDGELRGHRKPVMSLAVAPDGELVATASLDKTVRLWHLPTGRSTACLEDHRAAVNAVAMTPDGQWLASAGWDGSVRIWELPTGKAAYVLDDRLGRVQCLAMSPDGTTLACGTIKGRIHLWRRRLSPLHSIMGGPLERVGLDEVGELDRKAGEMTADELVWKDLIVGLLRWRGRHDVELGDAVGDAATLSQDVELGD